ncbi:MAG TPA: hypothetical protein VGX50_12940 [Longimicrobium sp.]|jgi:hypothetical protein|nr:hypothetical protein [Longimicrobium sp.]
MKIAALLLAGLALGAPATASATGICDQITGTYIAGRSGTFDGTPDYLAFTRIRLSAGVSPNDRTAEGHQVTTTKAAPGAQHVLLKVTNCQPLTATTARLEFSTATPGTSVFTSAGSADATVYDGGSRVWIRGNIRDRELPGYLLRLPPEPAGT